ncbi:MAG: hypothetical protein JW741_23500 [Sedimentisphaerales bacterium]|nr:hypothetical protein [Sedimentisphaerales bacterium]
MNIRDRMLAVYRGQSGTQPLVTIYKRYLPCGQFEFESRDAGLGVVDYYPLTSLIAPPWHLLPGYLSEVKNAEMSINYRWRDGQRIEIREFHTPVGSVRQEMVLDPILGGEWTTKHYIDGIDDYQVLQYLVENSVLVPQEADYQRHVEHLGEAGLVLGRVDRSPYQKVLIELAGPERFLLDLQTEPEPVESLLAALDRKMDEMFDLVLQSDAPVIWQPDNVTVDVTPPAMYEKYLLPFYEKHGPRLKVAGKVYVVHMDGRLRALADLIRRSPFDVVESFSFPEMGGDVTFEDAQRLWPEKRVFPNFPATLCREDDATIEQRMQGLLSQHRRSEPLVIQFSEDIPTDATTRVVPLVCRKMSPAGVSSARHVPRPHASGSKMMSSRNRDNDQG